MAGYNLILVHGFRGAPDGVKELAGFLRDKGHKVWTPALPPTDKTLPEYTPEAYADYLANFIKKRKIAKPIVIGHSMGSIAVAALAEKHPEVMNEKVIFMAPIATHPPKFIVPLAPLSGILSNKLTSQITTRFLFARSAAEDKKMRNKLFHKCLRLTITCGSKSTKKEQCKSASFACKYGIADFKFRKKAIFIVGEKDRLADMDGIRRLAKKYGNMKVIKNCGHLLNYECPEKVAEVISGFLRPSIDARKKAKDFSHI